MPHHQQKEQQQQQQQQHGAVRLGIKTHLPTVLVEYRRVLNVPPPPSPQPKKDQSSISNSTSKLRRKSIRLHNLDSSKDSAQAVASALSHQFPEHFGHDVVNHGQLVTLIVKLRGSISSSKKQGSLASSSKVQTSLSSSKAQGSLASSGGGEKDDVAGHRAQGRTAQRSIDNITNIDKKFIADDVIARETSTQPPEQPKHQGGGIVSDGEKQPQGVDIIVSDGKQRHQGRDATLERVQQQQQGGDTVSDDVGVNPLPAITDTVLGGVGEQQSEGAEGSTADIRSTIESIIGEHTDQRGKCGDELVDSLIRATEGMGDEDETEKCEEMMNSLTHVIEEDDYDFDTPQSKAAEAPPQATPVEFSDGANLNKVSEAELVAAKSRMDVTFQRNQLLPGEQGYAHDVRKDFGEAEEDCGWDDED